VTDRARALVVDGDPGRLQILCRVLVDRGFEVVTAQGGALGMERLKAEDFDCILSDLRMSDISGSNS
jgi:CheY-like chemotaxis protein